MKSFKEHLLTEGISPIVYHYTHMSQLIEILKTDKFKLTTDASGGAESGFKKRKKYYFMSTTRHKLGGYNLSPGDGGVMIKLDGRKLAQKYKGGPVDYWSGVRGSPETNEAEDRIWHDKQFIDNASKYILEVHSFQEERETYSSSMAHFWFERDKTGEVPPEAKFEPQKYKTDASVAKRLRVLWKLLLQKKIPHWFYRDKQSFLLQNKKKSIKIDLSAMKRLEKPEEYWRSLRPRKVFQKYQEIYHLDPDKGGYNKLSKDGKKFVYDLKYAEKGSRYYEEMVTELSNDIHNAKSDPKVSKIVDIFKKLRIQTPEEFIVWAKTKWVDSQ